MLAIHQAFVSICANPTMSDTFDKVHLDKDHQELTQKFIMLR